MRFSVLLVKRTNGQIETYICPGEPSLELAYRYVAGKITCMEIIGDDWLTIAQVHESSPLVGTVTRALNWYLIEHGLEAASA